MAIKFDDGSSSTGNGLDTVSAKNSGKNRVVYFRAPKEVDEQGNKVGTGQLYYILRLMKYSTDRREQPFIRKFEHDAWKINAEGKREFAGRITCVRSSYMQRELHLPHGAKAKDICPMCKYAESKFLAAKNGGDRTLYKQSFEAEAREHVYGVAYVVQDPNFKTNNGTLRVFRLDIPRVKKANRGIPLAYGICDELAMNMKKRGIDVMNEDGTSKNIYDLFCEVIQAEIAKGKAATPPYCVFNGGYGVDIGIRVKHVELADDAPYFGNRDMITNIMFGKEIHAINEIDPAISGESLEKMVNALDFDGNFMHVDTIDDIRSFCQEHYDLSASSADGFDDDDGFVDPEDTAAETQTGGASVSESDGFDGEEVPSIKPTSSPKPSAKPAPKKVETKSFDEIMDDFDNADDSESVSSSEVTSGPDTNEPEAASDDDMPF